MDGAGTITSVGSGAFGAARRHVGVARRGVRGADEPRGADRSGACGLLLDGALARARSGRHAARASSDVDATVTFVPGTGITKIELTVDATVPGIDEDAFAPRPRTQSELSGLDCARGVPEITLHASLS